MFERIVSGGQTGVDRAALDVALERGVACGGWCPKGREAEDGPLSVRYPLKETEAAGYAQRTEWNVRDSDGTLVLTHGEPTGGTALTIDLAARLEKPCLVLEIANESSVEAVHAWAKAHHIRVVNIAGPRESACPGIYTHAMRFLRQVLSCNSHAL